MQLWNNYAEKFLQLTKREQYIILFAGLFLFIYVPYTLVIETNLTQIERQSSRITSVSQSIETTTQTIVLFEQALQEDPNAPIKQQIAEHKEKLARIDEQLLTLTSELINPVQMRMALMELLALEPGVALASFEVVAPKALLSTASKDEATDKDGKQANAKQDLAKQDSGEQTPSQQETVGLYRHGIKLTLKGRYQALQDYLVRLEQLKWKFFWQDFELKVTEYPNNELSVTLYSLSTKREFIGV